MTRAFSVISIIFLFQSCVTKDVSEVYTHPSDSLIELVKKHNDSSITILKKSDENTVAAIDNVFQKMDSLTKSHESLKKKYTELDNQHKNSMKIVIRDTVYITERKNFWGKTKRNIDSTTATVDSLVDKEN